MTAITTAPDEETAAADERSWQARAAELVLSQGFIVIFLGWAIFLSIRTEQFLTTDNLLLLVRQASIFSIVGIGTTMVVLLGELDISFGSIVSLAGCVERGVDRRWHQPVRRLRHRHPDRCDRRCRQRRPGHEVPHRLGGGDARHARASPPASRRSTRAARASTATASTASATSTCATSPASR